MRGNPLKYTDPSGHTPYFDILGGGGGYGTKESMAAMGTAMALYVATYSLTVDQSLWEGPYVTPRSHSTPQDRPFETPHDSASTVLDTPLLGPEPRPDYATPGNSATTFQTEGLLEGFLRQDERSVSDLLYALIYEASPKHHFNVFGRVSPAPTNGQAVLDNSIQIKSTSPRRIGIDREFGEIVIFDQTTPGVFHGHVRSWNALTQEMKNTLINADLVTSKGTIK